MHQTVQAILREDKKYQAKKNLLEQESAQKVQQLRSQLEGELAKLRSRLKSKSLASVDGSADNASAASLENLQQKIQLNKKKILDDFSQRRKLLVGTITNLITQEK